MSKLLIDENGGHGYIDYASIGNKVVHVFRVYNKDNENSWDNEKLIEVKDK